MILIIILFVGIVGSAAFMFFKVDIENKIPIKKTIHEKNKIKYDNHLENQIPEKKTIQDNSHLVVKEDEDESPLLDKNNTLSLDEVRRGILWKEILERKY